jgi:hypothetical protein
LIRTRAGVAVTDDVRAEGDRFAFSSFDVAPLVCSNWVQTIPNKGWNTILRLYGPLEPWFDKTWRPGEIVTQ